MYNHVINVNFNSKTHFLIIQNDIIVIDVLMYIVKNV